MPRFKAPRIHQIAVGVCVCAAVGGAAYCLHKYISTPTLRMAETAIKDMECQSVDVPVGWECFEIQCCGVHVRIFKSVDYASFDIFSM